MPGMKPRFTGVPFVVYPVKNMTRARRFYAKVLGLRPGESWGDMWAEFIIRRGAPVLALSTVMQGVRPGAKGAALALETDRFDAVVAHLRKHRVKFTYGPEELSTCAFARFCDPDGNHLVLHRRH